MKRNQAIEMARTVAEKNYAFLDKSKAVQDSHSLAAEYDRAELATLRAERDALKEALERMTGEFLAQICFSVEGGNADKFHACLNQARAALARCKG